YSSRRRHTRLQGDWSSDVCSSDLKRLTFFRLGEGKMQVVVSDRDASNPRVVMQAPVSFSYRQPRWSPDDRSIAFLHSRENWADRSEERRVGKGGRGRWMPDR